MTNALRKIQIARTALILDHPFFGFQALRLQLIEDNSQPAMCTNGVAIKYNSKWVEALDQHSLQGVVAHEVMHCANHHMTRRENRESRDWNIACDRAINPILTEAGFRLPEGALNNKGDLGKSAEILYSEIQQNKPPGGGSGKGKGQGGGKKKSASGASGDPGDPSPEEIGGVEDLPDSEHAETLETDWKVATLQAANQAKAAGKLPASLERLIEKLRKPKVDWKAVLRRFIQETGKSDYSWRRPNPRFVQGGIYMPSLYSDQMPPIVWGVDTSGSIGADLLEQFAAEMQSAVDEVCPEKTVVIYCDADIPKRRTGDLAVDEFGQGEAIELNPAGGGGTRFKPVFDYVEKHTLQPACLIYLTDMYASDLPALVEPEFPVLWACTTDCKGPFGETVPIELQEDGRF